jgi:predicted DNA-binding transcriptional regulator AlpA
MSQGSFYTVGELSEVLRVSTKWCYQQLNRGNIPGAFRIGSATWFIDREVFLSTLKQKSQQPQPKVRQTGETKSRHDLV